MANSILWKDISCEEVGELLLTTEIQECKNRLYDNLSLSNLFSPPAIYNRQGSTDGAASSESMDTVEEKDTMRSPTCSQVEAEKPVQTEEKATIVVDHFFYIFSFCKENRWTANKISTLLSIMRILFIKDMNLEENNQDELTSKTDTNSETTYFNPYSASGEDPSDNKDLISVDRSMEVSFQEFKNMLLYHSVERPPLSAGIFEEKDIDDTVQYILDSYYRHYRLFKFIFTPRPLLFIEQGSMNGIDKLDPPPLLSEGILVKSLTEVEEEQTSFGDEKKNE